MTNRDYLRLPVAICDYPWLSATTRGYLRQLATTCDCGNFGTCSAPWLRSGGEEFDKEENEEDAIDHDEEEVYFVRIAGAPRRTKHCLRSVCGVLHTLGCIARLEPCLFPYCYFGPVLAHAAPVCGLRLAHRPIYSQIAYNMVRNYKTKTERNSISEQAMRSAIEDVRNGNRPIREAAEFHGLKKSMLHKRLQKVPGPTLDIDIPLYSSRHVFSSEEETLFVDYLIKCSKLNYGLPYKKMRDFPYFCAVKLQRNLPKSWE
ncbi:hypothetical protein PR048_005360 [Dryococelus australis]|uniref:HTH psq-type domain-containing protein n=1 Tax=Dryococelus australis TaxID=614101 RepID=A0ABQ9I917_9NEOP|nr:hypothetical protein PR048_005360 [Dryococelus australis]